MILRRDSKVIYRKVLYIAGPIILGSIAQNIIAFTDTAFLGRVGEIALGASAIGGLFYLAFVMLAFGFGIGAQIIMARRYGEGRDEEIGNTYNHALLFLLSMALAVFLFFKLYSPGLLTRFLASQAVRDESLKYLGVRVFGFFFAYINITYRAFYIAIGRTIIITWTTFVMAAINVFLDYVLIFGKMGFPQMGIEGAALASVIAECSTTLITSFYTWRIGAFHRFGLFRSVRITIGRFRAMFRVAFPMMLTNFLSLLVWFIFFMIIEKLSESDLAVSQLVRSVYIILLLPVWGFSSATNSLVSYNIGRKNPERVGRIIRHVMLLSAGSVVVVAAVVLMIPELVLRVYTDQQHLITGAMPVLWVISGSAVCLAVAFVIFNGVSGTGKTLVALIIEIAALVLYLLYAWAMATYFNGNVAQVWSAEYVYAVILALASWFYILYGNWKKARV